MLVCAPNVSDGEQDTKLKKLTIKHRDQHETHFPATRIWNELGAHITAITSLVHLTLEYERIPEV